MRNYLALLLICSVGLAASGLTSAENLRTGTAELVLNRFRRALLWEEPAVPSYLIPTRLPPLCTECCQADDYASPYRVLMLSPKNTTTVGGRVYTTFFMNLTKQDECYQELDKAGCCNANISTIWLDVDPALKVRFATLNDEPASIQVQQDNYGFRMGISPDQFNKFASSSGSGAVMSVTVEGDVQYLCPPPDVGPYLGLCGVIIEGANSTDAGACCPHGLSVNGSHISFTPPESFQCVDSTEPTVSPFNVQQLDVSAVFHTQDGRFVNYTLEVTSFDQCISDGPNSCCGMQTSSMSLRVMPEADVTLVTINGLPHDFSIAPFNQGNGGFKSLLLDNLEWDKATVSSGMRVVLSVPIADGANSMPQLFSNPEPAANGQFGAAAFFMHSDDGFCCPSGTTEEVSGPTWPPIDPPPSPSPSPAPSPPTGPPVSPPSPPVRPPTPPIPPAPPGTCSPQYPVPMADTSMTIAYYEHIDSPTSADFSFLVTNHNNAACKNQKPYCVDVCGWTLYVNDDIIPSLTFNHDDASNAGKQNLTRGDQAAVTFTYGPSGTQSITFGIGAPAGTALSQLCRPNAHPDQGSKLCAAKVLSGSNVYSMYFFNADDVVISNYPPPPPQPSPLCDSYKPMDSSCIVVETGRINTPNSQSTVVDFLVGNKPTSTGCIAEAPDVIVTFKVMLKADIVSALEADKELVPRDTAVFDSSQSNIMWTWTPPNANMQAHYTFNVQGAKSTSDICVQGNPGQPADTCAVQFEGRENCFLGFVHLAQDDALIWDVVVADKKGGSNAAVIAPAVAVPVAAVLAIGAGAVFFARRKKQQEEDSVSASAGSALAAPLVSEGDLGRASTTSAAASDVQIRFPGDSGQ